MVTDYETTKEKCPWMQLEEDQEFENEKKATEDTTSDLNTATEEELSALVRMLLSTAPQSNIHII